MAGPVCAACLVGVYLPFCYARFLEFRVRMCRYDPQGLPKVPQRSPGEIVWISVRRPRAPKGTQGSPGEIVLIPLRPPRAAKGSPGILGEIVRISLRPPRDPKGTQGLPWGDCIDTDATPKGSQGYPRDSKFHPFRNVGGDHQHQEQLADLLCEYYGPSVVCFPPRMCFLTMNVAARGRGVGIVGQRR